jgi:hypothetical protein
MRHKEIKADLVQETIDLINSYNLSKELSVNLVRNFNEFDPHPPENLTYGVGERDPNKLQNNFSKPEWLKRREYYLPDSISNEVVENYKNGIVSKPIDLKKFL